MGLRLGCAWRRGQDTWASCLILGTRRKAPAQTPVPLPVEEEGRHTAWQRHGGSGRQTSQFLPQTPAHLAVLDRGSEITLGRVEHGAPGPRDTGQYSGVQSLWGQHSREIPLHLGQHWRRPFCSPATAEHPEAAVLNGTESFISRAMSPSRGQSRSRRRRANSQKPAGAVPGAPGGLTGTPEDLEAESLGRPSRRPGLPGASNGRGIFCDRPGWALPPLRG